MCETLRKIVEKVSILVRSKAQQRTCSRNFENRVLRLINDLVAIDLLDDIGSIVKRTSLSLRERLLLICDRLAWRFSTPLLPRRKSARKQKKPQSARQHREQFRHLRRRDAVDALTALVLHGIPQLARTYIREPPKTLSQCCNTEAQSSETP